MTSEERIKLAVYIIEKIDELNEDYKKDYTGDYMLKMARSFLWSIITLEKGQDNVIPIRDNLGIIK